MTISPADEARIEEIIGPSGRVELMNLVDAIVAFTKLPIVERAYKTFVQATVAQAALYTTVVPNSPGVKTGAAVSAGATVLSIVWNALLAWSAKSKATKLAALAAVIDKAVADRLAAQAVQAAAIAEAKGTVPVQIPAV